MLCDRCHARPAVVHLTQIINGHKTERHLCSECAAKEHVLDNTDFLSNFDFSDGPFSSFFNRQGLGGTDLFGHPARLNNTEINNIECPKCGTSYKNFNEKGRLGCPECYKAFRDRLRKYFNKTQGTHQHKGKQPRQGKEEAQNLEILKLQEQLKKCVDTEDYEKAAKLRDQIQDLEKKNKGGKNS